MKTRHATLLCLAILAASAPVAASERDATEARARDIVAAFVGEVKPMLQGYMKTRGPVGAIEGCAVEAPEIADRMSASTGWEVGRVSLRPRSTDRGTPDAWETATLQKFEAMRRDGAESGELNRGEWVEGRYRYMQAQLVEGVCLTCHGEAIDPVIKTSIAGYYPDDSATGYRLGDVRGAVTLTSSPAQ